MAGVWWGRISWLVVAVTLLIVVGVSSRLVVLAIRLESDAGPPPYSAEQVPSLKLWIVKTHLENARTEQLTRRGTQSVRGAIGRLVNTHAHHSQRRQLVEYLRGQTLNKEESGLLVAALCQSRHRELDPEALDLIAQHGDPSHAPWLLAIRPGRDAVSTWFALLKKWKAEPPDEVIQGLLSSSITQAATLTAMSENGMGRHPQLLQYLTGNRLPPPVQARMLASFPPADRRGIQSALAIRRGVPLSWEHARAVRQDPPSEDVMAEIRRVAKNSVKWNTAWLIEHLPGLLALDDAEINSFFDLTESSRAQNPGMRLSLQTALVWHLHRHPDDKAAAALLKASGTTQQLAESWVISELAVNRPEAIKLAGIAAPADGSGGDTKPAMDRGAIAAALEALKGTDSVKIEAAYRRLAEVSVSAEDRQQVMAALQAPLLPKRSSGDAKRLAAYCRWAGPEQDVQVARIAMQSNDQSVQLAAFSTLLTHRSYELKKAARFAVQRPMHSDLMKQWEQSGEHGAEALCYAINEVRSDRMTPHAVQLLGKIGGKRARTLLTGMLEDPEIKDARGGPGASIRRAIESALSSIEDRLSKSSKSSKSAKSAKSANGRTGPPRDSRT